MGLIKVTDLGKVRYMAKVVLETEIYLGKVAVDLEKGANDLGKVAVGLAERKK